MPKVNSNRVKSQEKPAYHQKFRISGPALKARKDSRRAFRVRYNISQEVTR